MKPVNTISFKTDPKATRGRDLVLLVDQLPLVDWLEKAIPLESSEQNWAEKKDALVVTRSLKKSLKKAGEYDILTCAHCQMSQDILLAPFDIQHAADYVIWRMQPPGAGIYFDNIEWLEFKFHQPQYESTIRKILQR